MASPNGPLTVCVINLKGGVGKSTISALLARNALSTRQKDVLAIDLDPQADLSQALMSSNYNAFLAQRRPSIVEIFNGFRPASPRGAGSVLAPNTGVELIAKAATNSLHPDPKVLARFLAGNFQHKDLIIIDRHRPSRYSRMRHTTRAAWSWCR